MLSNVKRSCQKMLNTLEADIRSTSTCVKDLAEKLQLHGNPFTILVAMIEQLKVTERFGESSLTQNSLKKVGKDTWDPNRLESAMKIDQILSLQLEIPSEK